MDAELLKTFLKQAQKGEHLRRLMIMEEWHAVPDMINFLISRYDTVRGARADKEFLIRGSKVDVLEELLGMFVSDKETAETAMEELTTRDDYEA